MAVEVLCSKIYESVADIKKQAERLDFLREDARKLHRYIKRVEAVVSDLQPYYIQQASHVAAHTSDTNSDTYAQPSDNGISTAAQVLAGLHGVQAVLSELQEVLQAACSKGKLSTFLQADELLHHFQSAISDLSSAVASLPCSPALLGSAHQETAENIDSLRAALHSARFELPGQHAEQLQQYRSACDGLVAPLERLEASSKGILQQAWGHSTLSRDEFAAAVADLQTEVRLLQQQQQQEDLQQPPSSSALTASRSLNGHDKADTAEVQQQQQPSSPSAAAAAAAGVFDDTTAFQQQQRRQQQHSNDFYLRMMCDVLCVLHQQKEGVPLEFTCPITTTVMQDPVIIHETGHSYERQAIEDWFASGHRLCPKSGKTLGRKLNISPNHALRAAIATWSEANGVQLKWRPVLRGYMSRDSISQQLPLTASLGHSGGISQSGKQLDSTTSRSSSTSTDLDAIEGISGVPPAATAAAAGVGRVAAISDGYRISPTSSTSTDLDAIEGVSSRAEGLSGPMGGGVSSRHMQKELTVPMSTFTLSDAPESEPAHVHGTEAAVGHTEGVLSGQFTSSRTPGGSPAAELPVSKGVKEGGEAAEAPAGAE